jgi:hypothetical protein
MIAASKSIWRWQMAVGSWRKRPKAEGGNAEIGNPWANAFGTREIVSGTRVIASGTRAKTIAPAAKALAHAAKASNLEEIT